MKRSNNIRKIKIKYFIYMLILLGFVFAFHIISETYMRYYSNISAEAVGYAKENRSTTYSVVFNKNNGTGTMTDQTINYASNASLKSNEFTRTGYNFNKWNTMEDGSGTDYSNEGPINIATILENNVYNLYAQWQAIVYNIQYTLNGGTQSNPKTTYTVEDDSFTIVNPTKTGYTFKGWSGTALTGDTNTSVTIANGSTGNKSYTANWTVNTYQIEFDSNGGTGTIANLPMTYDVADTLTTNTFTRTGFNFTGWNTKADGTGTDYTDGESVSNLTGTNEAIVTLYAQWNIDTTVATVKKFDASNVEGNVIKNSDPNGQDGVLHNVEVEDGSLGFNGSNSWVGLGTMNFTNVFTVEATILLNEIQSGEHEIINNFESGGIGLRLHDGRPVVMAYINGDGFSKYIYLRSNQILDLNTKYHILGTYDGTELKIYVNGVEATDTFLGEWSTNKAVDYSISGTIKNTTRNTIVAIGANPTGNSVENSTYAFKGWIYNFGIYNVLLNESEIAEEYNNAMN